jgi:hypothetical protein
MKKKFVFIDEKEIGEGFVTDCKRDLFFKVFFI